MLTPNVEKLPPTKIAITDDLKAVWLDETIEQIDAGWKFDAIRRDLVRKGCTPLLRDSILSSAKQHVRSLERQRGKALILFGCGLIALGLGFALFRVFVLHAGTSLHITGGLGLIGSLAILRGVLKLF